MGFSGTTHKGSSIRQPEIEQYESVFLLAVAHKTLQSLHAATNFLRSHFQTENVRLLRGQVPITFGAAFVDGQSTAGAKRTRRAFCTGVIHLFEPFLASSGRFAPLKTLDTFLCNPGLRLDMFVLLFGIIRFVFGHSPHTYIQQISRFLVALGARKRAEHCKADYSRGFAAGIPEITHSSRHLYKTVE